MVHAPPRGGKTEVQAGRAPLGGVSPTPEREETYKHAWNPGSQGGWVYIPDNSRAPRSRNAFNMVGELLLSIIPKLRASRERKRSTERFREAPFALLLPVAAPEFVSFCRPDPLLSGLLWFKGLRLALNFKPQCQLQGVTLLNETLAHSH